jgi:hypothetical protein
MITGHIEQDRARLPKGARGVRRVRNFGRCRALADPVPIEAKMRGLTKPALEVRVECYAGHRGEETPRRFTLGRSIEVAEVLDAWLAPDHRYFKVRGDDGACYILRNDVLTDRWELTMFDRTGAIG